VPLLFLACAAITGAFVVTGPWTIGSITLSRLDALLLIWPLAAALAAIRAVDRRKISEFLNRDLTIPRSAIAIATGMVFLFLLRVLAARFLALEVNAWDFSLSFDRPIERTLHGELLWSEDLRHSMLGVHANWLLLVFVPLYAIVASPWWLIAGAAIAIAAAAAILFHLGRSLAADDFVAACVALAFVLNRYTARGAQFLFTIDVFYPLALFLLFLAFVRNRPRLFALALLFTVSIKEDAIVPLLGFTLFAAATRRYRWAVAALAAGAVAYAADVLFVIPGFSHWSGAAYANKWASFGATPLEALGGMARAPLKVAWRVIDGSSGLFATLALVPLAGWPALLAALPALIVYGSADDPQVRYFAIHYSMPLLPALFVAAIWALNRLRTRRSRRIAGLIVLAASALIGSSWELERPRQERPLIPKALAVVPDRPVYVQGALLPHAGYDRRFRALHHQVVASPESAYLLCESCSPYPFTRDELRERIESLRAGGRYEELRFAGLSLFRPRYTGTRFAN
jgi:uncharacterized membrane protein